MKMRPDLNRPRWSTLLAVTALLATAGVAPAQVRNEEGVYSTWDLGEFFGTQWFQQFQGKTARTYELLARPIFGVRSTQNVGRYGGLEESFGVGFNRLALLPTGNSTFASVGGRDYQFSVAGMAYLTPRDARYRPYILVGPAMVVYAATGHIDQPPTAPPLTFGGSLKTKIEPGFNIGTGVKMPLARHWGVRVDVRYLWTPDPNYGLPNAPSGPGSAYIRPHHGENGIQFTAELATLFGLHVPAPPPPPAPPTPTPIPPPPALTVSAIRGAPGTACPGDNIRLQVTASGGAPGQTIDYQWYVNNQPAAGGTGPAFNLPTADGAGTKAVRVTVTQGSLTATSATTNVVVQPLTPPTIRFTVSPTTINYGDRLPLNATATGSACGGPATVRYTASEGTINGTTFDSTGVAFDQSNRLRQQSKTVRLTATATDTKNQTASATADVTINLKPNASRQDIVFPNRSSRVNNAAKRYLIETLTPELRADPNSTVILVGHRDTSETGRAAATLDTQRVLNAAAVISAGKGVCPSLDLSRVQVAYVGTDQTTPPMPFGDASVKERSGQTATDQRSQFRRVEVWFVPGGADPPSIPGLMPAPVREIQAKGCPR